jgi:hypothetical protein
MPDLGFKDHEGTKTQNAFEAMPHGKKDNPLQHRRVANKSSLALLRRIQHKQQ